MIEAPMGDARFFSRSGPHALADIASAAVGTAPAIDRMFNGVAPLQSAGQDEVSFLDNGRYAAALERTMAGAVIVHPQMQARVPSGTIAIVTTSTYEGWARVAALFHPVPPPRPGIHPSALVDRDAQVDASAEIGPYAVVEARAEIGPGCRIGSFVSIGTGVTMGRDCRIGAHASLSHALLGSRVYIYPGARIGQEGFSFATTKTGFLSVPQLGRVIVEDDVEVGANTTIDRGSNSRHDHWRWNAHRQLGADRPQRSTWPLLRDCGAGRYRRLNDPGGFRSGRRTGCHGWSPACWPRQSDWGAGRRHFRCSRRGGITGQSRPTAQGVLPASRHAATNDLPARTVTRSRCDGRRSEEITPGAYA